MTMMCVRCYLEGRRVPIGMRPDKNPPFSFMVYEGESRCTAHLPAPAYVENEITPELPEEFPALAAVPEVIETDNRFVVEDPVPIKKTPAKKAPAKKAAKKTPQQRRRTKS